MLGGGDKGGGGEGGGGKGGGKGSGGEGTGGGGEGKGATAHAGSYEAPVSEKMGQALLMALCAVVMSVAPDQ